MDDKNAFARQIAAEIDYEVGPPHPVDALAITRTAKTPSPRWRIRSMLSPAKAITAGALAFAIGGVLLIAQPFDQQSSVPGATTEAIAPTWVTGDVALAPSCTGPDIEFDGDVRHDRNYECSPQIWTASDPRFTGEVALRWNEDVYRTDEGAISVSTGTSYFRNDDGGWVCSSSSLDKGSGLSSIAVGGGAELCVGEGGYEGLSAVLVSTDDSTGNPFVGLIFSGDLPPLPEPPPAG